MKKLMFIRHGNAFRQPGIYDNEGEVFLSEKGEQQVKRIKPFFNEFAADRIVSSTIERCRQTTDILIKGNPEILPIFDERLRERAFSSLFNLTFEEIETRHGKVFSDFLRNEGEKAHLDGEETLDESCARVVCSIKEHVAAAKSRVAIISHGGPHSWLICHILGLSNAHIRKTQIGEARISLFEFYDDGTPSLVVSVNAGDAPSFYAR